MVNAGITEGILLIASIIVAAGLSAMVISKAGAINSAFTMSIEAQKDVTLTKIKILYATGTDASATAKVWIKNIGINPINNPQKVDVYFGQVGSIERVPYNETGDASDKYWEYNGTVNQWLQKDTVEIHINNGENLLADTTYLVRISTSNGIVDEYFFSISSIS